jgi:hypothetical protein
LQLSFDPLVEFCCHAAVHKSGRGYFNTCYATQRKPQMTISAADHTPAGDAD